MHGKRQNPARGKQTALHRAGDRVCWAETRRKTGPLWELPAYGAKHPARKDTRLLEPISATPAHTTARSLPCGGQGQLPRSPLHQTWCPLVMSHHPPGILMSEMPQSTEVTSSLLLPKPSSAPLLLLSSPSHGPNTLLLPPVWFPTPAGPTQSTAGASLLLVQAAASGFALWEVGTPAWRGLTLLPKSLLQQAIKN